MNHGANSGDMVVRSAVHRANNGRARSNGKGSVVRNEQTAASVPATSSESRNYVVYSNVNRRR